ncbi:IS30 family transposase [Rhodococcus sp. NPDC058514]|uniref:IS30 family transposase n=1 Tax=Rhodococcus sp. NPDC058514 TaxID=3346532 RepID=UPI00365DCD60
MGLARNRKLFRLVCRGATQAEAGRAVGLSRRGVQEIWYRVQGPPMHEGKAGTGVAVPGDYDRPAGRNRPLSFRERLAIMRGLDRGVTPAEISRRIGRHRSVVSREITRNASVDGDYDAHLAHARAAHRALRPKKFKLKGHPLCSVIEKGMDAGWSPKLIADMLARWFPDDREMRVSHETIYKCLYVQTRGSLRADLAKRLSTRRSTRLPRNRVDRRGKQYADAFKISDRPAEANDRAVPGHWEGDLIVGTASKSAIGTLVERSTRYTLLLHLPDGHRAEQVADAMLSAMMDLPEHLRRTITWDRGSEMAQHERIRIELGAPVYFCDPYSPWQRGTNENTNRLLRHWFAKGTDLNVHDAAELKRVQDLLNTRPRPTLDYDTPADRLRALIAGDVALTA